MAMGRSLLGCVLLACTLSLVESQQGVSLPESVFRVLSAEQLRELNFQQNPELLDIAAKTGENVTILINSSSQGGVVQENVNTLLDCTPWLMNFPGGTVRWYKYRLSSLNHNLESDRTIQNPMTLNSMRLRIEGEHDELFRIIRGLISEDAEDSSRGIYECEVCIARGIAEFEICHSANTTILNVGRPPIINEGMGREPVTQDDIIETYNIGSTICINIDPVNPERNRPMQIVRLQCADVGDVEELNIPSALPTAVVSWEHTSLDGTRTAFFAENAELSDIVMVGYMPPPEFAMEFPLLVMTDVFSVSTNSPPATSALDFATENITKNISTPSYQALMQAFGTWTCTLNNSLGSDVATTFISDMCGMFVPSIVRDCVGIGTAVNGNTYLIDSSLSEPITAGCDICVPVDSPLSSCPLTLTCPTTAADFGASVVSYLWTRDGVEVSRAETVSASEPGVYTCTVVFDNGEMDSASSRLSNSPDVTLGAQVLIGAASHPTRGCDRLRITDPTVAPNDVCIFYDTMNPAFSEVVQITCETSQANVTATVTGSPQLIDGRFTAVEIPMPLSARCFVNTTDPDINPDCAGQTEIMIHTFEPARIPNVFTDSCTADVGMSSEVVVNDGDPVTLCCEPTGSAPLVNEWFRIRRDANGIPFEERVNDTLIDDYSIDPTTHTLTIANYNGARDDGTYVCRTENIVGIDVSPVAVRSGPDGTQYDWGTSDWCDCDPFCTGGTRNRTVFCQVIPDGNVVRDTRCDCDDRPAEVESCENVPGLNMCFDRVLWKTGEFSKCSKGCSGGVRTRDVYCANIRDGSVVHDYQCEAIYGPDATPSSYDICYNTCCVADLFPTHCRNVGTNPCNNPIYQQNCCWTCGLDVQG